MAPQSGEMSLAAFAGEVPRRGNAGPAFRRELHPLSMALKILRNSPTTPQSILLGHRIIALATGNGTFREPELYLFDAAHMAVAADLIFARTEGVFPENAWQAARVQLQMALSVNGLT